MFIDLFLFSSKPPLLIFSNSEEVLTKVFSVFSFGSVLIISVFSLLSNTFTLDLLSAFLFSFPLLHFISTVLVVDVLTFWLFLLLWMATVEVVFEVAKFIFLLLDILCFKFKFDFWILFFTEVLLSQSDLVASNDLSWLFLIVFVVEVLADNGRLVKVGFLVGFFVTIALFGLLAAKDLGLVSLIAPSILVLFSDDVLVFFLVVGYFVFVVIKLELITVEPDTCLLSCLLDLTEVVLFLFTLTTAVFLTDDVWGFVSAVFFGFLFKSSIFTFIFFSFCSSSSCVISELRINSTFSNLSRVSRTSSCEELPGNKILTIFSLGLAGNQTRRQPTDLLDLFVCFSDFTSWSVFSLLKLFRVSDFSGSKGYITNLPTSNFIKRIIGSKSAKERTFKFSSSINLMFSLIAHKSSSFFVFSFAILSW